MIFNVLRFGNVLITYAGSPRDNEFDDEVTTIAAGVMQDESARSETGFFKLPDIGNIRKKPAPTFNDWDTGADDQERPPLQATARQPPTQSQYQPPPTHDIPAAIMSIDTMTELRKCLPNLSGMADNVFRTLTPSVLLQLNASSQPTVPNAVDAHSAAAMAAAAAAHFAQSAQTVQKNMDPAIKMARALEHLQKNPVDVVAGKDDRITILHIARFLPGQ